MNQSLEQLYGMGLLKDRRRRIIKPLKDKEHAYQILDKEMKRYSLIASKLMYISIVYVLALGVFRLPMFVALLLGILTAVIITVFEKKFYSSDRAVLKMHVDDIKQLESKAYLKAQKSNILTDIFLTSMSLLLTVYEGFFNGAATHTVDIAAMYVLIAITLYLTVYNIIEWVKIKSTLKGM